jgi:hypothetical protein
MLPLFKWGHMMNIPALLALAAVCPLVAASLSWALFEHALIASITDVISKSKLKKRCAVDKTQRHRKVRQDNKGHTTSLPDLV